MTDDEYHAALAESQRILAEFPNEGSLNRLCDLAMAVMIYETEVEANAAPPS